jgi:hypothetical protein
MDGWDCTGWTGMGDQGWMHSGKGTGWGGGAARRTGSTVMGDTGPGKQECAQELPLLVRGWMVLCTGKRLTRLYTYVLYVRFMNSCWYCMRCTEMVDTTLDGWTWYLGMCDKAQGTCAKGRAILHRLKKMGRYVHTFIWFCITRFWDTTYGIRIYIVERKDTTRQVQRWVKTLWYSTSQQWQ